MLAAILARIFTRLEQLLSLWQAGNLQAPAIRPVGVAAPLRARRSAVATVSRTRPPHGRTRQPAVTAASSVGRTREAPSDSVRRQLHCLQTCHPAAATASASPRRARSPPNSVKNAAQRNRAATP